MDKVSEYSFWLLYFILALILLILSVTGRLGVFLSIAFVPDNVALVQGS